MICVFPSSVAVVFCTELCLLVTAFVVAGSELVLERPSAVFSWIQHRASCVRDGSSAAVDLGRKELILKRKAVRTVSFCACEKEGCTPLRTAV